MGYGLGDQGKPLEEPNGRGGRSEQAQESLNKKNAGADQYEKFYAWGNETAPVEVIAPPTVHSAHIRSVRRADKSVKGPLSYPLREPRFCDPPIAYWLIEPLASGGEKRSRHKREP